MHHLPCEAKMSHWSANGLYKPHGKSKKYSSYVDQIYSVWWLCENKATYDKIKKKLHTGETSPNVKVKIWENICKSHIMSQVTFLSQKYNTL